jgi:mannose-6-phosphate isomerase-like protein (cupin superfamily)
VSPLSEEALVCIAAGLASVDRFVPGHEGGDYWSPRYIRLIATDAYDVWLITWPAHSGIDEHDHADATSVMRVVSGRITECTPTGSRLLGPDVSVVVPPHTPHRLRNESLDECTTVHVYSPSLEALKYGVSDLSRVLHPAGATFEPRIRRITPSRAEASAKGHAHPIPPVRRTPQPGGQAPGRPIGFPAGR